jgi:hypothetical protein
MSAFPNLIALYRLIADEPSLRGLRDEIGSLHAMTPGTPLSAYRPVAALDDPATAHRIREGLAAFTQRPSGLGATPRRISADLRNFIIKPGPTVPDGSDMVQCDQCNDGWRPR